ncbi:Uncharacterized membrane protein YckC, RDD family [Mucilaginibacter pineti]|uniref:Uncharacterized membrane protein YckC, RDD family n=1 Tax=Mucilaginibacter pineti TaxID=1391627 RepID=A0A1G6X6J7_9SPHI|nr:RDD family protein [Mucilaginibacter pineti]SDD73771.1 Uncharacterized membrane protein YckC, RDD family [Mucilaginibacter pineti]
MINEYFVIKQGQEEGPYTHTDLMDMRVAANDLVKSPLFDDWQYAADLPEFKEHFMSLGIYLPDERNVANFWWRLLAYAIDYVVLFLVTVALGATIAIIDKFTINSIDFDSRETDIKIKLFSLVLWIFYNAAFEATKVQGSLGKAVCKLVVVNATGERLDFSRALGRNAAKIISAMLCGLGFLSVFWNPMNQAWHDQMAGTYVVKKS